jgi:hypothetical protein
MTVLLVATKAASAAVDGRFRSDRRTVSKTLTSVHPPICPNERTTDASPKVLCRIAFLNA